MLIYGKLVLEGGMGSIIGGSKYLNIISKPMPPPLYQALLIGAPFPYINNV
jgi:hypothetical protein